MKAQSSRIAVILDRSGSMEHTRTHTIDGFNEFVNGQRAVPGECKLRLVQFDYEYQAVFDKPLAEAGVDHYPDHYPDPDPGAATATSFGSGRVENARLG